MLKMYINSFFSLFFFFFLSLFVEINAITITVYKEFLPLSSTSLKSYQIASLQELQKLARSTLSFPPKLCILSGTCNISVTIRLMETRVVCDSMKLLWNILELIRISPEPMVWGCGRYCHMDMHSQSLWLLFCWSTNHQLLLRWSGKESSRFYLQCK